MTEIIRLALAALFFMLRSLAKLKLQTNFDAIFKTVNILKIGPVEPKLWKIREITLLKQKKQKTISSRLPCGRKKPFRIFHNFGSTGPIFKIFAFLETASKFISTF